MFLFELISWALFGLTVAGIGIWLMRRRDHTRDLLLVGVAGALIGGMFGRLFSGAPVFITDYNVLSLLLAIAFSSAVVYFFWHARYRTRPGEH